MHRVHRVDRLQGGHDDDISAADRAATFRALANADASPDDFSRPGHVFLLRAVPGGVLEREAHGGVGRPLSPRRPQEVGVLCGCQRRRLRRAARRRPPAAHLPRRRPAPPLAVARVPQLLPFCKEHGLVLTSIADIKAYIQETQGK